MGSDQDKIADSIMSEREREREEVFFCLQLRGNLSDRVTYMSQTPSRNNQDKWSLGCDEWESDLCCAQIYDAYAFVRISNVLTGAT